MASVDNIEKIVKLMQTDDSVDAPADSIQWVKGLFLSRPTKKSSFAEKIFAVLQMDIPADAFALGERSAAAEKVRQVLFTAGDIAVDLRISQGRNTVSIRGQLLGEDLSPAAIDLIGNAKRYSSNSDENAEFAISNVEPGVYAMEIALANDKVIAIERLDLP